MLISIQHRTEFAYGDRISESIMEVRMVPRTDRHQTLRGFGLAVGPAVAVFEYSDWLGNQVHQFSVIDFHDRLIVLAHSAVETHPRHPKLDDLHERVGQAPDDHRLRDYLRFGGPIVEDERLHSLADALGIRTAGTVGEVIGAITNRLQDRVSYKKGVTTSATTVSDVLVEGAGVCQDFAHLSIALLRLVGIPGRYVSGYLHHTKGSAELETHAWCEAYVPSAGWFAFDPTQRRLVDESHIAVAVGRSYADVPPNRGIYRGGAREQIRVLVKTAEVSDVPKGLLAPRAGNIEAQIYAEGPREMRDHLKYLQDLQQQQQQQQQAKPRYGALDP